MRFLFSNPGSAKGRFLRSSRTGLLIAAAGLALMGAGICRGEIMGKAVNICLECIGIG